MVKSFQVCLLCEEIVGNLFNELFRTYWVETAVMLDMWPVPLQE